MKRLIPFIIVTVLLAAMMLLAGMINKKQRPVSYEGAVMVTANASDTAAVGRGI